MELEQLEITIVLTYWRCHSGTETPIRKFIRPLLCAERLIYSPMTGVISEGSEVIQGASMVIHWVSEPNPEESETIPEVSEVMREESMPIRKNCQFNLSLDYILNLRSHLCR